MQLTVTFVSSITDEQATWIKEGLAEVGVPAEEKSRTETSVTFIACSGNTGDTRGGGHGAQSCSPISAVGCSQYPYNGGGQFKLCQYSDADCGTIVESGPNGGAVTCVVFPGRGKLLFMTKLAERVEFFEHFR
ncbi:hypothetical protein VE02_07012 [Pseudogymnoascus sp. 03VT05]|nr:hypothetical protein VE02_07012 [Pseudogymnoascus sp. 03VT05]